jgi:hypothetical protein
VAREAGFGGRALLVGLRGARSRAARCAPTGATSTIRSPPGCRPQVLTVRTTSMTAGGSVVGERLGLWIAGVGRPWTDRQDALRQRRCVGAGLRLGQRRVDPPACADDPEPSARQREQGQRDRRGDAQWQGGQREPAWTIVSVSCIPKLRLRRFTTILTGVPGLPPGGRDGRPPIRRDEGPGVIPEWRADTQLRRSACPSDADRWEAWPSTGHGSRGVAASREPAVRAQQVQRLSSQPKHSAGFDRANGLSVLRRVLRARRSRAVLTVGGDITSDR